MRRFMAVLALALLAAAPRALAQSQAINGTIEGVVQDATGAALPGVTVTVTQLETGSRRVLTTSADGSYRALLLPLGSYRVRAELTGFKVVERTGVSLSAGQTALVDVTLEVGGVSEVVTVTGDSPVAQPGKIDLGRTISRGRDQEPAAGVAQPLQLRVPAGQRHRLREQRVRRAAHQRQRQPDAHELPDRRKHQHPEGPRRPAHAADLRGGGAGGQGHHARLRSRVRPDDRHGLQRGDPVGHQRRARAT